MMAGTYEQRARIELLVRAALEGFSEVIDAEDESKDSEDVVNACFTPTLRVMQQVIEQGYDRERLRRSVEILLLSTAKLIAN